MRTQLVILFAVTAPGFAVHAQVFTFGGLNLSVPDSNASGVFDERVVSSAITSISRVAVTLAISGTGAGAFNGDLYVTLAHTTPGLTSYLSVLVNRPGRRAADELGYSDNGLSVILDDASGGGDLHAYRFALAGNHDTPLAGALGGIWHADGRALDPASSGSLFDATAPSAGLAGFNGFEASGTWRLFVADVGEFSGGTARLDGWSLDITGTAAPVPEPMHGAIIIGLGLGLFALLRSRGAAAADFET